MDKYEIAEAIDGLSEYYSSISGHLVNLGITDDDDIWIASHRTNGKEYLESIQEAERRLEILYSDLMIDDGYTTDPLEGL
jgi:hypothetical protein